MCAMCDGETHEKFLTGVHERVQRFGFTMLGVEPDPDHPPWLYTLGLVEHHDHPELSILGAPLAFGYKVLDELSGRVLDGECFEYGDEVVVGGVYLHVDVVDDRLWDGDMFNQWKEYYLWRGDPPPAPSALELIVCGSQLGVFSSAAAQRPNRAARRARMRRTRHR
jgi:hypothetical protein